MNPLPPQAYTKDTLVKAYSWLTHQGPSIKEMANTPDILVSLYLKATRDGDSSLDRPSIQNFKNELKSLAGLMGQLDGKPTHGSGNPNPSPIPASNFNSSSASAPSGATASATPASSPVASSPLLSGLDALSLSLIHEVKTDLNLSTEIEALRMLIKIGHARTRNLL